MQVGSITQDPKFDYRQEFTQYLRLEKESVYNVETTFLYINVSSYNVETALQNFHIHIVQAIFMLRYIITIFSVSFVCNSFKNTL